MGILRFDLEYGFGNGFATYPPPKNWQGIATELSWTNQFANAAVNGVDFIWTGINADMMLAYKQQGLVGGLGITEGVGMKIYEQCGNNNWELFFYGYVNLADPKTKWECDEVAAPSVELYRVDWFVNKTKAMPFSYLKSINVITAADYKQTPYCIVKISQAPLQEAMIALTELAVLKQGIETVKDISTAISTASGDAATATATGGLATPTVVATIVNISFDIVYLLACATTLIVEGKKIIDSVWQFKKYKLCMREEDVWKKICQHLNLQFSSTIYSSGIHKNKTWMPRKNAIRDLSNPLNFLRGYSEVISDPNYYGHPDGLASDFIAEMCDEYFGEVAIRINPTTGLNTLYFERRNNFNNVSVFTIPNTGMGYTHNLPQPYQTNLLDLPWNYEVIYSIDPTEETTGDSYRGTSCSKHIEQTIVGDGARCGNGLGKTIQLTSSIGRRKNTLSKVENFLNNVINAIIQMAQDVINLVTGLYNAIAWVINLFGGNVQPLTPFQLPTNLLNNRLGWLELTDDKFSVPKSFVGRQQGSDWVLDIASEQICAAETLMTDFHQYALPTHGAQQELYNDKAFKMCCADFIAIKNTNVITSPDGRAAKFTKMIRTPHDEMCRSVNYGIFSTQTNNLTERTSVDGI